MHIIDELIEERAQKLRRHAWAWRLLRPALYKALGYKKAVIMADAVFPLSGREAFQILSDQMQIRSHIQGAEHIPTSGPVIIISNHPTGLADGVFVFDALQPVRSEHIFMANADALRVIPKCEDIIIPVEWVKEKRTPAKARATLLAFKKALQEDRAVVIFPSGVLAHLTWRGLTDKAWNTTAVSMAKKHNIPIVPLHIKSRNSVLYYVLSKLNNELRDITLFHELLNKSKSRPTLTFGPVIDPKTLPKNSGEATQVVREIVESL
ncbi:MAG TPA: acyltransferase [Hellea balneolensis]|uniref:Acyltransferase n=1 Tax=Hellea balneolensis TaxID=287478 RepID=A0A7C3CAC3_9PROT|nr:acyltransferase [Hellea balneolensis]